MCNVYRRHRLVRYHEVIRQWGLRCACIRSQRCNQCFGKSHCDRYRNLRRAQLQVPVNVLKGSAYQRRRPDLQMLRNLQKYLEEPGRTLEMGKIVSTCRLEKAEVLKHFPQLPQARREDGGLNANQAQDELGGNA